MKEAPGGDTQITKPNRSKSWLSPNWLTWNKFSEAMLRTIEKKILQFVKTPHRGFYVDIGPTVGPADKIWTLSFNQESKRTPLVLLHGLGAGAALWCLNLDALAASRPVYAIDLLGFGRSSRPDFSNDSLEAERQMVSSIEEWRKEVNLEKILLLGHSMGAFLAASYAIRYPERVQHLILADPWGFPEKPEKGLHQHGGDSVPLWIKTLALVAKPFNPLAGIRAAGPFGPWLINTVRPDISKKYSSALNDPDIIPEYIYQCNSQHPSGESAFYAMMHEYGWAKNPMVRRIDNLSPKVPITLLYGSRSWVDHSAGEILQEKRIGSYFKIHVVSGAGHHVYADRPDLFNEMVKEACEYSDGGRAPFLAIEDNDKGPQEQDPTR